jgi:hypothetical protein
MLTQDILFGMNIVTLAGFIVMGSASPFTAWQRLAGL